jgi:hypothetical protein
MWQAFSVCFSASSDQDQEATGPTSIRDILPYLGQRFSLPMCGLSRDEGNIRLENDTGARIADGERPSAHRRFGPPSIFDREHVEFEHLLADDPVRSELFNEKPWTRFILPGRSRTRSHSGSGASSSAYDTSSILTQVDDMSDAEALLLGEEDEVDAPPVLGRGHMDDFQRLVDAQVRYCDVWERLETHLI